MGLPLQDQSSLLITTPGVATMRIAPMLAASSIPNASIVAVPDHDFLENALRAIKLYTMAYGTQKILLVHAHGNSLLLSADPAQSQKSRSGDIYLPDLLAGLKALQKELGIKVADRIVFNSCDVMTDLSPQDVQLLRATATELGAEIVGATTKWMGNKLQLAEVAKFGPDGSVSRDQLSATGFGVLASKVNRAAIALNDLVFGYSPKSDSWFYCHAGQAQDAGAACQVKTQLNNYRAAETRFSAVGLGAEIAYIPNDIPDKLQLSSLGAPGWLNVFGRMKTVITSDAMKDARAAIELSRDWSSDVKDVAAVDAHQRFIRSLSPSDRQLLEQQVNAYVRDVSAVPQARPDSRDTTLLKLEESPVSTGATKAIAADPQIRAVAPTAPTSHL